MKKIISIILVFLMVFSLTACGGKDPVEEDPNVGIWHAVFATFDGETLSAEDLYDDGFSLDFRAGGKCVVVIDGEREEGKWTFDNGQLVIARKGDDDFKGNIEGGILTLVNLLDTGMDVTFEKEGGSVAANFPTENYDDDPGEENVIGGGLSQLQEWWHGDWYGYWETHSETDNYVDFQEGRWECFALIQMNPDDTGDIYLWDPEGDFAMANISVSEDGGSGEMGAAISNNGQLWFGAEIGHADWIIDPSLYGYENYMVIDGRYNDELGGGFNYIVHLRPWGETWDENLEDERPLWYDTWYLSAYNVASMWEAIEDRDGHIHSQIGNISVAEQGEPLDSSPSDISVSADISNIKGKTINAGNISLLCPDGWVSFTIPDYISSEENAVNPNGLDLRKGSEGEGYEWMMPMVEVQYYEHGWNDKPENNYGGKSEEWGPVELGGRTWKGFIGIDDEKAIIWTKANSEYSQIVVRMELEAEGVEISLNDADVQAIISSIEVP